MSWRFPIDQVQRVHCSQRSKAIPKRAETHEWLESIEQDKVWPAGRTEVLEAAHLHRSGERMILATLIKKPKGKFCTAKLLESGAGSSRMLRQAVSEDFDIAGKLPTLRASDLKLSISGHVRQC